MNQCLGGYFPEPGTSTPNGAVNDQLNLRVDSDGNLCTRGPVTTDEGSFREDFSGATIYSTITGSVTFKSGYNIVFGAGTTFTDGTIQAGDYIRLSTDANTDFVKIINIVNDTRITIASAYTGTGGTGTAYKTKLKPIVGAGGAISVASSLCTITSGTTTASKTEITREIDYGPLIMVATATVSARNANQTGYIGFVDDAINPTISAWFVIDGTVATTIKTVTQFSSAAADIETNSVTIATTASARRYRIELAQEYCGFYVDDILVATHKTHLPSPYAYMDCVVGWVNGTTPTTANITLDSLFCGNVNALQVMTGFGTLPMAINNTQIGNQTINTGGVNGAQGVAGSIAHDSAGTTSYPVKVGARAITANYTAVATGDVADAVCTLVGAQITKSFSIPELDWSYGSSTAITNTSDVVLKSGAAGLRAYCTGLQYQNTSATATVVVIKDGSTVIWACNAPASMTVPANVTFQSPIKSTAAAALNFACITTASNTYVAAQGYQAP